MENKPWARPRTKGRKEHIRTLAIGTADTAEGEEAAITFFNTALNTETGLPKLFTIGGGL